MTIEEALLWCLKNGGVALFPTDTVYGLAAMPIYEEAVNKIFELKCRPKNRFLPIMVANVKDMEALGLDLNENAQKLLASSLIPGAITLVLGFVTTPTVYWLQGREEIAIRIPNNELLLSVLEKTGPLLVTSANKHSLPNTPNNVDEILAQLEGEPTLVIDDGECQEIPSTIVNCRFPVPVIERQGSTSAAEIFKIIDNE